MLAFWWKLDKLLIQRNFNLFSLLWFCIMVISILVRALATLFQNIYYLIYKSLLSINFLRRHTKNLNGLNGNTYSFDLTKRLIGYFRTNVGSKIQFNTLRSFFKRVYRSSHPEVFLRKGVLKTCSKFTGEHPCQSVISIKLHSNVIEITLQHECSPVNLLHIFRIPFLKGTSEWFLLDISICSMSIIQISPESEEVAQRYPVKKVFIKISDVYKKTPVPESLF